MTGFFNRLAQRTLGTAQVVRPSIAPRFAQPQTFLIATNALPSADTIEEIDQQTSESSIKSERSKGQKAVIERVPTNSVLSHRPLSEQQRPSESPPAHVVEPYIGLHEKQPERLQQNANIVKSETIETKNRIDRVKPIMYFTNDTGTRDFPDETEPQIIPDDHANQFSQDDADHDHPPKIGPPADSPLVPIPVDKTESLANFDTHFEDSRNPMDTQLVSGMDGRKTAEETKQQGAQESQSINVTIGRIEVRAVHPPPAPVKRARAKLQSTLSLDDYLQQRRRGER